MKQFILFFAVCFFALSVKGQITISDSYFPAPGDTLKTYLNIQPSGSDFLTPAGPNQVWNFGSLTPGILETDIVLSASLGMASDSFPNAEVLIQTTGAEEYYNVTANTMEVIGYSGEDPVGLGIQFTQKINPAIPYRRAPLEYGSSVNQDFALLFALAWDDLPPILTDSIGGNLPFTPDSIRVGVSTERFDNVDAWGSLTIPGGTFDVLRERREEHRMSSLEILDPLFGLWIDVTGFVVGTIPQLAPDTTVSYLYFAADSKEPVARVLTNADESFLQSVRFKAILNPLNNKNIVSANDISFSFSPNPIVQDVTFTFNQIPAGQYTISLYNILGNKVWERSLLLTNGSKIKENLQSLRRGTYIVTLQTSSEKVLAAKRLLIIKP